MNLPSFSKPPGAPAIDLDGTLLNSQAEVSERNRRALENCIERGIPVIIATSRPRRWMRHMLGEELAAMCSFILGNGAVVKAAPPFQGDEKAVIPREIIGEAIYLMVSLEPEIGITLEIEGYEFGTNRPREADELWRINRATPEMQLPLEEALERGPTKIAFGGLGRSLGHVVEALGQRFGDELSLIPSDGATFLNVTMQNATKPLAMERLIASRGLTLGDVLAFGDDIPDLDMLTACGTGIAMANACDEVLTATPWCTASNDEDGVALAWEKLLAEIL